MKAVILYSTRDGQTYKIAQHIAGMMQQQSTGVECELVDLTQVREWRWDDYDCVLIGASIRYGHFVPELLSFVTQHQKSLSQKVSGFYSVNLTARKPEKATPQTNGYTVKFLDASPWTPDLCAVFAGALRYPRYRWFDRFMIRLIMKMTGGETDTSKEVEYTNWVEVDKFAVNLLKEAAS